MTEASRGRVRDAHRHRSFKFVRLRTNSAWRDCRLAGDVSRTAGPGVAQPGRLLDLYWAGRTTLVTRRDHIAVYDEVFRSFFLGYGGNLPEPVRRVLKQSTIENQTSVIEVPATEPGRPGKREEEVRLGLMASDIEIWRHKSFAACTGRGTGSFAPDHGPRPGNSATARTRRTHPTLLGPGPDLRRTTAPRCARTVNPPSSSGRQRHD